jgi:hypothetical protein
MYSSPYYVPRSYRPYGRHTYRQIGGPHGYLHRTAMFAGHSMSGEWHYVPGVGHRLYFVRSHDRVIGVYDPGTGRRAVDHTPSSQVTARHEDICDAWLPGEDEHLRTAKS